MENGTEEEQQVVTGQDGEGQALSQDAGVESDAGDADFDAGFSGAPTETPGQAKTTEGAAAEGEKPADGTAAEPASNGQPAAAAPEYVQITADQFSELMAKAKEVDNLKSTPQRIDQAFGKIGGIERILHDLKNQPTGQPVKISEEDFAELQSEFPELASLHAKGMQRVLDKIKVPGVDPAAIETMVGQQAAKVRTEVIDSHLDEIVDGDWRAEVKTQAFEEFIGKQKPEVQALQESSNLRDAAKLMRLFKAHRDAPPPQKPAAPSTKGRVIAAAVAPRGTTAAPMASSEDDDFNAGFKSG